MSLPKAWAGYMGFNNEEDRQAPVLRQLSVGGLGLEPAGSPGAGWAWAGHRALQPLVHSLCSGSGQPKSWSPLPLGAGPSLVWAGVSRLNALTARGCTDAFLIFPGGR